MKSREDLAGLEFDWIASDGDGHVALFTTAGGGHVPAAILGDPDVHDQAIDEIACTPPTTEVAFAPALAPELWNVWRAMAERGLFAYDSDPFGGPYRLVAAPVRPTHTGELPPIAAETAKHLAFPHLSFAAMTEIGATALGASD